MTPEKSFGWVELYGNASAFAGIALCARDKEAAANFTETAELALAKIRAGLELNLRERSHDV